MLDTVTAFKSQEKKTLEMLQNLFQFIEKGEAFGLKPNTDLLDKLKTALHTTNNGILKVALIGGFSEGKTSIASAWLERLEQSMNINQQESSNEVKIYSIGNDIELIDTPGLFGFKEQENSLGQIEKYKEITKRYVSEAHLVLYVMNSANPIKDSHAEDLKWLFRELNLLSRTVFVLSRFDEVADIEDEWDYRENLKVKKDNVTNRLKSMIGLNEKELASLKIVAVAANPFGEGIPYWLNNLEEFKKISRISTLQDATRETILENGGATPIVFEAQKSMIQDVLRKQMPIVSKTQEALNYELVRLSDAARHLNSELEPTKVRIGNIRADLADFILGHFTSLIRRAQWIDMSTFSDFYESEIGVDGIVLNSKIESEFQQQCQVAQSSIQRISLDFDNELTRFQASVDSDLVSKGISVLSKQKINNTHVLAARDGIVAAGKMVGMDLAKYLKFKPWGAVNAAAKANVVMAVAGLAYEAFDSYKKSQEEAEFKKTISQIVSNLEKQRIGLLETIKSPDFIEQFFPEFTRLQEKFELIQHVNAETENRKCAFDEWCKEGEAIEGQYKILSQ